MEEMENDSCFNNDLVRKLLCATQLSAINFEEISSDIISLILTVLSHPILQKYPLKTRYLTKFLKKIINQMENNENDSCDDLYLKYVELIQKEYKDEPFYKHYIFGDDVHNELSESIITIKENASIVSQGTTGLCTWQAGVALGCWCLKNKDKLRDKFIIELGSGTGLSGIAACVNCNPQEYWFTDCHLAVLKVLEHNIEINKAHHKFECKYDIVPLSWDNINNNSEILKDKKPDLVLAADVVFDKSTFESLCQSLKYFTANSTTEVILFCTLRNPDTFNQFLETLKENNMVFTKDILPDNYSIVLQQDCPIYIVNVKQHTKHVCDI